MSGYKCFQIELSRGYDYAAFREDLKKLYQYAGVDGENTVFLFSDTQVILNIYLFVGSLYRFIIVLVHFWDFQWDLI